MPIIFTGSMQEDISLKEEVLNQSAETLESAKDNIVLKLINVVEQDMEFQKDYLGYSKGTYQNAINTLYGRCHGISEVQLHYAEELEKLAIDSIGIDTTAGEMAGGGGTKE